jgi:voltage-gated potassium channel
MRLKAFFSRIYLAVFLLVFIFIVGVFGFHFIQGYDFVASFYMTVITVSTVGLSPNPELVSPLSEDGMMFSSFLIIFSISFYAYSISILTSYFIDGELKVFLKDYKVEKQIKKLADHTIICGYGRNGKEAVRKLQAHKKLFVVIESKPERVSILKQENILYVEGDATLDSILIKANIDAAQALITTLPNDADNVFIVLSAREQNSDLTIISRASEGKSNSKLKKAGATNVIMPDKLGGSHMASLVITPDVVEFLDNLSVEGTGEINLEELTVSDFPEHSSISTLRDLEARYKTGCTVIGFRTNQGEYVVNPGADTKLKPNSKLFVLGKPEEISRLNQLLSI